MGNERSKIRLGAERDIEAIQKLGNVFRFMYSSEIIGEIEKRLLFVYEEEEKIMGFILYNAKKDSIMDLIVGKEYRGQGIGGQLFKLTIDLLNVHHLKIWASSLPISSVGFWKRMGFQEMLEVKITKGGNKLTRMLWTR